jgi:hypothetical protein
VPSPEPVCCTFRTFRRDSPRSQVNRWPGVHFAKSILVGKPLKGLWCNRTEEFAARNRGEDFGRLKYAEEEDQVRASWNSLLSWLMEAAAWGQGAEWT